MSGNGWSYVPSSKTLTLNGFDGTYIGVYRAGDVIIELKGDNICSDFRLLDAGYDNNSATIIGDGTLTSKYVIFNIDVTMLSGTITVNGINNIGLVINRSATIAGGVVNTTGRSDGLKLDSPDTFFRMTGGVLNTNGGNFGITGDGEILLEGGTVTAQGGKAAIWLEKYLWGQTGPLSVSGGKITGGETAEDAQALSICEAKNEEYHCITVAASKLTVDEGMGYYWAKSSGAAKYVHIAGQASNDVTSSTLAFSDVSTSAYYADAVRWAVSKEITNGTSETTFSPDATCTQAQIITFLYRTVGEPAVTGGNPYTTSLVTSNQYYYNAMLWAYQNGIVTDASLNPNANCARSDVVTYLWRLAGAPTVGNSDFEDVPASASYAQAVAWAVEQGITTGTSATAFSPDTTCSRGQIVTFMYRAYAG